MKMPKKMTEQGIYIRNQGSNTAINTSVLLSKTLTNLKHNRVLLSATHVSNIALNIDVFPSGRGHWKHSTATLLMMLLIPIYGI